VHSRNIYTSISSNFNTKKKELFEDLCDSGLDQLIASIDGGSQEVYSQYRQGGALDLVLENLRHVVAYKKRKNLRTPTVQWRFLSFPHNEHEVETARVLAEKIGVDDFVVDPGIVPQTFCEKSRDSSIGALLCIKLWHSITFQSDGGISPCCNLFDQQDDFGTLAAGTIRQTWHNARFQLARKMFDASRLAELPRNLDHPCLYCPRVQWQPHMRTYLEENPCIRPEDAGGKLRDEVFAVVRSKPAGASASTRLA
jgi:hypothetical protein